jgi:hypothetical protein
VVVIVVAEYLAVEEKSTDVPETIAVLFSEIYIIYREKL